MATKCQSVVGRHEALLRFSRAEHVNPGVWRAGAGVDKKPIAFLDRERQLGEEGLLRIVQNVTASNLLPSSLRPPCLRLGRQRQHRDCRAARQRRIPPSRQRDQRPNLDLHHNRRGHQERRSGRRLRSRRPPGRRSTPRDWHGCRRGARSAWRSCGLGTASRSNSRKARRRTAMSTEIGCACCAPEKAHVALNASRRRSKPISRRGQQPVQRMTARII